MGEIGDELAHLLEGVGLHENVVLGEQQGGDLAQLAHGRRVRVGDDVPVRGARRNEVSCGSVLQGIINKTRPKAIELTTNS